MPTKNANLILVHPSFFHCVSHSIQQVRCPVLPLLALRPGIFFFHPTFFLRLLSPPACFCSKKTQKKKRKKPPQQQKHHQTRKHNTPSSVTHQPLAVYPSLIPATSKRRTPFFFTVGPCQWHFSRFSSLSTRVPLLGTHLVPPTTSNTSLRPDHANTPPHRTNHLHPCSSLFLQSFKIFFS